MSKMPLRLILLAQLGAWPVTAAAQITLVAYSFEDTVAADIGSERSTITWNSGGVENYANGFSGFGRALSVSGFEATDYYELTLDATGYGNIALASFRSNGTDAAPLEWTLSYSLSGANGVFIDASNYTLTSVTATEATTIPGIALPAGADNNASLVLRLVAASATRINGTPAANGTVRLDNLSITATAIPEPALTAALTGLGGLLVGWWGRRRHPVPVKA